MSNPTLENPEVSNNAPQPPRDDYFTQKSKRKRSSIWKMMGLGVLLVAGGAAGYLGLTNNGHIIIKTAKQAYDLNKAVHENPNLIFDQAGSDHVNILLIGRDANYKIIFKDGRPVWHKPEDKDDARSDSMIVMSLDKTDGKIRMVSLPRDARVHLPPNKYDVRMGKLNAAHAYGGPELLVQTLHDELGLTVQHYAVIRFDGFKKLIDEVGGVYVDVIGALKRDGSRGDLNYDDNWGNLHIHLKPGKQWLNGEQAHNYVRFRMDIEGDPGRIRRQQSLMRALAQQLKHQSPLKIPSLLEEIRRQFKTDMTDEQMASAAYFAKNLGDGARVQPITLFGVYSKRGSLLLNKPKNELLMQTIFGSTFNPNHFLQNSPWTEGDEIAPDFKNSPETQELLREAGLLKDHPSKADRLASAGSEEPASVSTISTPPVTDSPAPLTVDNSTSFAAEPTPTAERPRRHRSRRRVRERTENTDSGTRIETTRESAPAPADSSGSTESPIPRAETREAAPATGDLSVESPVPQPEQ